MHPVESKREVSNAASLRWCPVGTLLAQPALAQAYLEWVEVELGLQSQSLVNRFFQGFHLTVKGASGHLNGEGNRERDAQFGQR